jgi:hypothetical protein
MRIRISWERGGEQDVVESADSDQIDKFVEVAKEANRFLAYNDFLESLPDKGEDDE